MTRKCCDHGCNQGDDCDALDPVGPVWMVIYYAVAVALSLLLALAIVIAISEVA